MEPVRRKALAANVPPSTVDRVVLRDPGDAQRARLLAYEWVSASTKGTARLSITMETRDNARITHFVDVADGGGGVVSVFGAVELAVTTDAVGTGGTLHFATFDDGESFGPLEPVDAFLELSAVGPAGALQSLGWRPWGRTHVVLYSTDTANTQAFWRNAAGTILVPVPYNERVLHPPRWELVTRNAGAVGIAPNTSIIAVWHGT